MFEKIFEGFKTKFPGVDPKILERIARKKAETTTTEEEAKTVVDGTTFQSIIESEADRRATEAQVSAVANYEKKHNLKAGKPIAAPAQQQEPPKPTTPEPQDGAGSELMAMLTQMQKDNKAMRDQLDGILTEKRGNQRKAKYEALLAGASDKLKERYMRDFDRLAFNDDDDFNGWYDKQKPFIEADIKEEKAAGAAQTPPLGGQRRKPGDTVDPAVTAYLDSEAAREGQTASPVIIGLSQGTRQQG